MFRYDGYEISLEEARNRIAEGELELVRVIPKAEVPSSPESSKNPFKSVSILLLGPPRREKLEEGDEQCM